MRAHVNRFILCNLPVFFLTTSLWAELPPLVNIADINPRISVDLRYATPDNFTHVRLYSSTVCYVTEGTALKLSQAQVALEREGLGLRMWDCFRPQAVQETMWALVPDERFVAPPQTGSRHNRGASVDVTLVDKKGRPLPMPTAYDDFSARASATYADLPKKIIRHRDQLRQAMSQAGFIPLSSEWWHFDDADWARYERRGETFSNIALVRNNKETSLMTFSLPKETSQILLSLAPTWEATTGTLQRFEKVGANWNPVGIAFPVSLGLKGSAWGVGLHPLNGLAPLKVESDAKTPAGVFRLGQAYGYNAPPPDWQWPFRQVDETWRCVDDASSSHYNEILSLADVPASDWKSAELMRRKDHLYAWLINVEQNTPVVKPAGGSCIFLHVWRRPQSPTEGCVAMEEKNMLEIMGWLKPDAKPVLIQLPRPEYVRLKSAWNLP